jgi:hypothetical protein
MTCLDFIYYASQAGHLVKSSWIDQYDFYLMGAAQQGNYYDDDQYYHEG